MKLTLELVKFESGFGPYRWQHLPRIRGAEGKELRNIDAVALINRSLGAEAPCKERRHLETKLRPSQSLGYLRTRDLIHDGE